MVQPKKEGSRALRKQFLHFIRIHDVHGVVDLLDGHPNLVDSRNSHGHSPIGEAIKAKDLEMVQLLFERGAAADQINHSGSSLIDAAVSVGSHEITLFLKSKGARVVAAHYAELGMLAELTSILESDLSVIRTRDRRGGTVLHAAARGNHTLAVELCVERGLPVDVKNKHGHTPLANAVEAKAICAVRTLLKLGADVNAKGGHYGGHVLHRAIIHREPKLVCLLLDSGADPDLTDAAAKSALHQAVAVGNKQILQEVLRFNPDDSLRTVKTRMQRGNEMALDVAIRAKKITLASILREYRERVRT